MVNTLLAARYLMSLISAGIICAGASISSADEANQPDRPIVFHIPSQPLVSALNAYGATTQIAVFYDGALAFGRRSTAVEGKFTPLQALRRLLQGTDFMTQSTEAGTITITPPGESSQEVLSLIKSRSVRFRSYLGLIQAALGDALCKSKQIETESIDVLVRFGSHPTADLFSLNF